MCSAGSNRHAFKHTAKWNSAFRWWSGAFLIFCGMGCPQELPRGVTQRSRFPTCALFGPTALGRNCPACRSSAPAFSVAVDGQLAPSTRHPVLRPHSAKPVFRSRCGLPSESRLLASSHTNGLLACPLESLRDIHARMARPKFPWLNLHAGRAPQVIAVLRVAARKACESENSPLRCNKSPGRNVYLCESNIRDRNIWL
jgi:hypothetical protein